MQTTRRTFLAGLGALLGGLALDPATGLFVPRRKIWVVGAKLERPEILPEVKAKILSEYLQTPEGRASLAASMILPLRRQIQYQSFARKVFQVEQLPEGASPIFLV